MFRSFLSDHPQGAICRASCRYYTVFRWFAFVEYLHSMWLYAYVIYWCVCAWCPCQWKVCLWVHKQTFHWQGHQAPRRTPIVIPGHTGYLICLQFYLIELLYFALQYMWDTFPTHVTKTPVAYLHSSSYYEYTRYIQSFTSPTNAQLICFKILQFTLNIQ